MAKELKTILLGEFRERFADLSGCVLIDYARLNSELTHDFRAALRQGGVRMSVIQNRLARRALLERDDVPDGFGDLLRGPIAVLFGEDGPLSAAKIVADWRKKNRGFAEVRGGLLEGKVLQPNEVVDLAKIPDKPTLRAQVAGTMLSPLAVLASAAQGVVSHLAGCAKARHAELGGE